MTEKWFFRYTDRWSSPILLSAPFTIDVRTIVLCVSRAAFSNAYSRYELDEVDDTNRKLVGDLFASFCQCFTMLFYERTILKFDTPSTFSMLKLLFHLILKRYIWLCNSFKRLSLKGRRLVAKVFQSLIFLDLLDYSTVLFSFLNGYCSWIVDIYAKMIQLKI